MVPLHIAAEKGRYKIVKCLVGGRADINIQDIKGVGNMCTWLYHWQYIDNWFIAFTLAFLQASEWFCGIQLFSLQYIPAKSSNSITAWSEESTYYSNPPLGILRTLHVHSLHVFTSHVHGSGSKKCASTNINRRLPFSIVKPSTQELLALGVETGIFEESMQTCSQKFQKGVTLVSNVCTYIWPWKHARL